jgi:hypothetical protein
MDVLALGPFLVQKERQEARADHHAAVR